MRPWKWQQFASAVSGRRWNSAPRSSAPTRSSSPSRTIGGEIEASVPEPGWADNLTEAQRAAFDFALRGLFDMAAATRSHGRARPVTWAEWVARW